MLKKIIILTILVTSIFVVKDVKAEECNKKVGPGKQYPSIQEGINAASINQTVCVYYDTYNETVNINKNGLTLLGMSNNQGKKPVIDGEYKLPKGSLLEKGDFPSGTSYGYVRYALVTFNANNTTLDNFEITRSRGRVLLANELSNITVKNVAGSNSRKNSSFLRVKNLKVINTSLISTNNFAPFTRDSNELSWGAAINTRGSKGVLFDGLIVAKTWGEGINPLFSSDVIVKNSVSYDNWRLNMYSDNIINGLFENNLSFHTEQRPKGMPKSDGMVLRVENAAGGQGGVESGNVNKNIVIRNNFFINNSTAISTGKQNTNYKNENIQIYNNTIINPEIKAIQFNRGDNDTGFVKGNIIIGGIIQGSTGLNIKDNLYLDPGLVDAKAKMTPGQTNVGNYKLKSGSSAINKGPKISGLTKDYFGCLRDSKPDYGAYEFGGTNCDRGNGTIPTPPTPTLTIQDPTPTPSTNNKYDVTGDGVVDIMDIVDLIKYIFR